MTKSFLHMIMSALGSERVFISWERVRGSSPDSAENHLDQGAQGDDIVRSSSNRLMVLPGFLALNARTTVRVLAKPGAATATVKYSSKCDLLEDAGGSVGMTNEE